MAAACLILRREISTTCVCKSFRNFREYLYPNKRGSRAFKEQQRTDPKSDVPIDRRGTRRTGYKNADGEWIHQPEMIPEIIVPDLKGFSLKPYVSYKAVNLGEREFTPKDLFDQVYAEKIKKDFKAGALKPDGQPMNPSENELLTPEEAKLRADKTGTDLFTTDLPQS